ncbi:MAG TPA: ABC transporter permease [Pirellulales bacterium]|jgi:ABC-type Na+ efflux pump permease subunit
MHKSWVIARREYKALVQTKAFLISLVMMPIFMLGGIVVQTYMSERVDVSDKKVVVLDGTGRLYAPLEQLTKLRNAGEAAEDKTGKKKGPPIVLEKGPAGPVTDDLRLELSDKIHKGELFAFVEIDPDALTNSSDSPLLQLIGKFGGDAAAPDAKDSKSATAAGAKPLDSEGEKSADSATARDAKPAANSESPTPPEKTASNESESHRSPIRMHMDGLNYNSIGYWLGQTINQSAFVLRLQDSHIDPIAVIKAYTPINYEELGLFSKSSGGEVHSGDSGSRSFSFFVPLALLMLMFMSVMVVCQPMISSVLEEKQQRIAEVLLGSANPFQLMMGKLMGNVGVALTIVTLYLSGSYFMAQRLGYADLLPTWLIGWFVVFEVLACVLYGSIFIAIGSACSDLKDAQTLLTPIMLGLVFPLMVWFTIVQEPMSTFAQWISFFPPATPMLMLLRMASTSLVPWWQPVLGMVCVLATTMFAVFAAGRIFRIGVLLQGKAPKMTELARWVFSG